MRLDESINEQVCGMQDLGMLVGAIGRGLCLEEILVHLENSE